MGGLLNCHSPLGVSHDEPAKSYELIERRFSQFGFPLSINNSVIPSDDSTLFVCSGMQNFKKRFFSPDGEQLSTLQSCIRTNDLDLVGDGTHLTYFQMLGNFSFGGDPYEKSVSLWDCILRDLNLKDQCTIHFHPESEHVELWKRLGYETFPDQCCTWTDGAIGGYCCEVYIDSLEIGNLVNPLNVSTDVGFGWERLAMIIEGKSRIDETSLFDQKLSPIMRDHVRCLNVMWDNCVHPGNKGRNYICRKLLRRCIGLTGVFSWSQWLNSEIELRNKCLERGKKLLRKHHDKPLKWWWETCGLTEEDFSSM